MCYIIFIHTFPVETCFIQNLSLSLVFHSNVPKLGVNQLHDSANSSLCNLLIDFFIGTQMFMLPWSAANSQHGAFDRSYLFDPWETRKPFSFIR